MDTIIFLAVLSVLILVHEWGHFITAKKLGVKVEQFALGIGKKIFSFMHNGTEFRLCAFPLGGYVKMAGDERAQCKGSSDEYFSKSPGHRALIVLMGPVVNIVFAYLCFCIVFMIGYVDMDKSSQKIESKIGEVLKGSAAQKAGLLPQDKILAIGDKKTLNWPNVQDAIAESKDQVLTFSIERSGVEMDVEVTPENHKQKDIFGRERLSRRVGISPDKLKSDQSMVVVKYNFFEALGKAGQELWDVTLKTYQGLYEMVIGVRSAKEAMGIVGIFFVIKYATSVGLSFLLHIVGVISASLAIFNLLPIIPLDGGHLLLLGIEKLRKKPLPVQVEEWIMKIGFTLIIMLALFIFYVDFERIGLIERLTNVWHRLVP
ncbi:MAG: site-2 protease family protein [Candidatus Omnitrophica bacterium]|nr:site-2 protease family protein [Candidatus Omnitrophota bacterium]